MIAMLTYMSICVNSKSVELLLRIHWDPGLISDENSTKKNLKVTTAQTTYILSGLIYLWENIL